MQVGEAFNKSKAYHELKLIASDPDEDHAFKVTNYMALDGLLNKLQESIIRVEGEAPGPWPAPARSTKPLSSPAVWSPRFLLNAPNTFFCVILKRSHGLKHLPTPSPGA